MQYRLATSGALTATEFENTDLKEIEWFYGRLAKQRQDEHEQMMKTIHGQGYSEHPG
jgi:hypothetical protein